MTTYEPSRFPGWRFLLYGGYFHRHQLPELAARSQHHHLVPPHTNVPTTFQRHYQQYQSRRESESVHPEFLPPFASVVFVNSVWFLSLVLSLTCALITTLLQQWTRRYLRTIQRNYTPHFRAHIREYFFRGAGKLVRKSKIFGLIEFLSYPCSCSSPDSSSLHSLPITLSPITACKPGFELKKNSE